MPGMSEADQLQMIDGFFTMVFAEDTETLRQWSAAMRSREARPDRSGSDSWCRARWTRARHQVFFEALGDAVDVTLGPSF